MRTFLTGLILALGLAACATVPATMDPELFEAERSRIESNPSIAASEADLATILARTDLTEDQRVDMLYLRADKRWDARYDLPGAIVDLDQVVLLRPEDARVSSAERRKIFAATEVENAQRRLAQLQNLPDWFDDKVLMGDLAATVERYRASQITPTDAHLYLLREAGYVCDADGEGDEDADGKGEPVHHHGPEPDYAVGAVWCNDPSVS